MAESLSRLLSSISDLVWGPPMLALLVGTHLFLTIRLGGVQFRGLPHALWLAFIKRREHSDETGDISHFQALMTALAATVGTGNIAGVATAIAAGGPGALFWMWMTGLFGMASKYAEAVLAVRFRSANNRGEMSGGPMYYITRGLNLPWLGALFAVFAAIAAFGIGNMVQSNSVAAGLKDAFAIPPAVTGAVLALLTGLVLLGGIKSIARASSIIVPVMVVVYMAAALVVIAIEWRAIPAVVALIFESAFSPVAAAGGFAGSLVRDAMRFGIARGVFSNESGLGSSPIAAAAAKTKDPATQALVSMTQTFIDTIVVCSMTGFAILVTNAWQSGKTGAALTNSAFATALPGTWGGIVVTCGLVLFAYSTLIGWSYYGEKAMEYLLGIGVVVPYRVVFTVFVFFGAVLKLDLVWSFADIMNGLMALPNLIALLFLSGIVVKETKDYWNKRE